MTAEDIRKERDKACAMLTGEPSRRMGIWVDFEIAAQLADINAVFASMVLDLAELRAISSTVREVMKERGKT